MSKQTPRTRGPYAKTRVHRASIAEAALALVIERGHANVTPGDVAARAGLTEATVNYHFPTRDHLFIAVLAQADADELQLGSGLGGTMPDTAAAIRKMVAAPASHANRLRLFTLEAANATDPEHPGHEWFVERGRMIRASFADILRELQAAGEAHPEVDPELFARQMVAVWDGLQIQWLVEPNFDLGEQVATAFQSLARADVMVARRAIEELVAGL